MTLFTKEMQGALEADGEKLRQLTGHEHGPQFEKDEPMKTPTPSVSPLLATISAARARMAPLKGVDLACAAVEEMKLIVLAFDAYQDELESAQTKRVLDLVFPEGVPFEP